MKLVSIIMPAFNAERYLPEALQCILRQTYQKFELICIDDCSVDGTRKVIEKFQKTDDRIRIMINEEHLGAAPSRNKGLKAAKGEYIIFLDGDDIFEEELLEKASGVMEKYQADLVLFEYLHAPSETIYVKRAVERPKSFMEDYCRVPFSVYDFRPREFPNWSNSPCDKMFRKSFLIDNKLEFQNLPSSNDVYFAKMTLFCAKKIIWLDDRRIMVYARDHSQPSRISNDRDPMCAYYAMEKLVLEFKKRNMLNHLADFLYCAVTTNLLDTLLREKNEKRREHFYNFLRHEGVPRLIGYGKNYYNKIESYDKYLLESLQNKPYGSGWFYSPDTYFQFHLKKNGQTLLAFIKDNLEKGKRVVLWGVGVNGKSFLDYLDRHFVRISAITDMDRNKQGSFVNGYRISEPDAIWEKADLIVTTSKKILREIKDKSDEIVTVDLQELIV